MSDSVEKQLSNVASKRDSKRKAFASVTGQQMLEQGLDYIFDESSNVVDQISNIRYDFDNSSYTDGQNMNSVLNTGNFMLYGPGCYFVFDLEGTAATTMTLASSCAAAIVNTIVLKTKNGTDAVREQDVANRLNYFLRTTHSKDWLKAYGSCMGYAAGITNKTTQVETQEALRDYAAAKYRVVIPMGLLCGFFNQETLIPASLTAGMKVSILLESAQKAFLHGADVVSSFTVSDPHIMCQQHLLMDFAQAFLIRQAGQQGLSYVFDSYVLSGDSSTDNVSVNITVNDQLSKTVDSVLKARPEAAVVSRILDSFASADASELISFQVNLGGYFEPSQVMDTTGSESEEAYAYVQENLWKQASRGSMKPNSVSKNDYKNQGMHHYGVDLIRSDRLSGVPIASTKQLQWKVGAKAAGIEKRYTVHTRYVKLITAYNTNETVFN